MVDVIYSEETKQQKLLVENLKKTYNRAKMNKKQKYNDLILEDWKLDSMLNPHMRH